ncbi:MAG: HD domain-containing protein [Pseudohongiellaceae bacterium]
MTPRYTRAISLAASAHEGQLRKGTDIPYITHPVAVAELVARYGGDEDQQIGALLHDVLEDGGESWTEQIKQFGERVYAIVRGCSDCIPDANGEKPAWKARKAAYIEHLRGAHEDTLFVSGCDKLHNLSCLKQDLKESGPAVFERFNAGAAETIWYYSCLVEIFESRGSAVANSLREELSSVVAGLPAKPVQG